MKIPGSYGSYYLKPSPIPSMHIYGIFTYNCFLMVPYMDAMGAHESCGFSAEVEIPTSTMHWMVKCYCRKGGRSGGSPEISKTGSEAMMSKSIYQVT